MHLTAVSIVVDIVEPAMGEKLIVMLKLDDNWYCYRDCLGGPSWAGGVGFEGVLEMFCSTMTASKGC